MSVSLDVDIAALVGEMEDVPCESAGHNIERQAHDDGPAAYYARAQCASCGRDVVKSYCSKFTQVIVWLNPLLECNECGYVGHTHDIITILGPVKS